MCHAATIQRGPSSHKLTLGPHLFYGLLALCFFLGLYFFVIRFLCISPWCLLLLPFRLQLLFPFRLLLFPFVATTISFLTTTIPVASFCLDATIVVLSFQVVVTSSFYTITNAYLCITIASFHTISAASFHVVVHCWCAFLSTLVTIINVPSHCVIKACTTLPFVFCKSSFADWSFS
jgi:hypothetical protein